MYSPDPEAWVTHSDLGPFCTTPACSGKQTRVREIGGEYLWESPFVVHPPEEVMAE